jgi:hypothetical protein
LIVGFKEHIAARFSIVLLFCIVESTSSAALSVTVTGI